jgi:hypothetical protein
VGKKVIIAGLLGGLALMVWMFVVNGVFGFHSRLTMKEVTAEQVVYEVLKEQITEPGRYVVNPAVDDEGRYRGGEPVFSVLYGGMGHEAAGFLMLVGLAIFVLAPMLGAWMLSRASNRVLSSYPRKVMFFLALGVQFALVSDMMAFGIGGYPLKDVILLGLNHIGAWTVVGLVIAWRITPDRTKSSAI